MGDKLEPYPIRRADNPAERVPDHVVKSNKLLRDREGGIWIGTDGVGTPPRVGWQGGDFQQRRRPLGQHRLQPFRGSRRQHLVCQREGTGPLSKAVRLHPSGQQGPSSEITKSVLASTDGSVWVAASEGVTRWKDGRLSVFRKDHGMPDIGGQSLFAGQSRTRLGEHYMADSPISTATDSSPSKVSPATTSFRSRGTRQAISGFRAPKVLRGFKNDRLVENIPWTALGREHRAQGVVADRGGVWLGFWVDGGVLYFKDGKVRETYTTADGLGAGHVSSLRLDRDGALVGGDQTADSAGSRMAASVR